MCVSYNPVILASIEPSESSSLEHHVPCFATHSSTTRILGTGSGPLDVFFRGLLRVRDGPHQNSEQPGAEHYEARPGTIRAGNGKGVDCALFSRYERVRAGTSHVVTRYSQSYNVHA